MGLFLGIDAGTQSMKAIAADTSDMRIAGTADVNYGRDLPQYRSPNGFLPNEDPLIRRADPRMWLDALELLLQQLLEHGIDPAKVDGISGSGQQHGSVYLSARFPKLDPKKSLTENLNSCFTRASSPIWMDRSTAKECAELTSRFGESMRSITGSPAVERFTGPQIRKFASENPSQYAETGKIHLVSSFLCSVLCGKHAPVDFGDGAGMNLLDLRTMKWNDEIAEFTAPGLRKRLPRAVDSASIAGKLDPYFEKFGFRKGIPVVVWTGDNPGSLAGVGAAEFGSACISLGTSDTFFAPMRDFLTDPDGCGHVFGNPSGGFMSLICFTNGSLAREKVRDLTKSDWNFFDREACRITVPGNGGRLMLPWFEPESTPRVLTAGAKYNYDSAAASPEQNIRAVLESQALSMKLHSAWQKADVRTIRLTGGASKSEGFRQILADVFQAEIQTVSVTDASGLGSVLRAASLIERRPLAAYSDISGTPETIRPRPETSDIYTRMQKEYCMFEKEHTRPAGKS